MSPNQCNLKCASSFHQCQFCVLFCWRMCDQPCLQCFSSAIESFSAWQVCIEIVGYLLEELRDVKNYELFQKDIADANIFIGSLIFIEELAEKVWPLLSLCPTQIQFIESSNLHLEKAYSNMFEFCPRLLQLWGRGGMSWMPALSSPQCQQSCTLLHLYMLVLARHILQKTAA